MPRKLGQHFLNNPEIINQIITSSNLNSDDIVLEIGPGEGVLTNALSKTAKQVIAIEIDDKLIPNLKERFANKENVGIIHGDVLDINLPELLKSNEAKNYKLIANIPYYITSKILRTFLETEIPPEEIILMVQKEVAERIVASPSEIPAVSRGAKRISRGKPGKMSKLSVSVQYYGKPEYLFTVEKDNFNPPPEVDSAVIKISNIKRIPKEESKKFFRIVRAGFCARRKTLANNISNSLHIDKLEVQKKLKAAGILPTARAQELSVEDWEEISDIF